MPKSPVAEPHPGHAAVPEYVGSDFTDTPPGHRFGLYLRAWDKGKDFILLADKKRQTVQELAPVGPYARDLIRAARRRQARAARTLGPCVLQLSARSTSPLVTGTGIEHPLENGFAFLSPYGIPYLPGSSIKGVIRRAAEELALGLWEERRGWDIASVWWLFGFEAGSAYLTGATDKMRVEVVREAAEGWRERFRAAIRSGQVDLRGVAAFIEKAADRETKKEYADNPHGFLQRLAEERSTKPRSPAPLRERIHFKGALCFWDGLIEPAKDRLAVDILNPHFGDYYQKGCSPADCGQPVPNFFLTVAPGSQFDFFVQVVDRRLPDDLSKGWRGLIEGAFRLAFEWHGLGAKGAVGYGRLQLVPKEQEVVNAGAGVRTGGPSEFEAKIAQIRALPHGGQAAGQISPFVDWCLALADAGSQRVAAIEILKCLDPKWVKTKAKEHERWRKILAFARDRGTAGN